MTKTEVWYPENATVELYTHIEKETAGSTIDGANVSFTIANAAAAITGIDAAGSPLTQFADANGSIGRRDVLVYKQLNETDTPWDTTADGSIVVDSAGSEIIFQTAPTTAEADYILVSYGHTKADKTHEVTSVGESGGDRPVEFITTYGGYKIKTEKPQENYAVDIEVLKQDLAFAEIINDSQVVENIAGSGSVYSVTGGGTRVSKVLAIKNIDPVTTNRMILVYHNVSGVSKTIDAPAEENYTESVSFESKPEDKTEIYWEK